MSRTEGESHEHVGSLLGGGEHPQDHDGSGKKISCP